MRIINKLTEILSDYSLYIIAALFCVILLITVIYLISNARYKASKKMDEIINKALQSVNIADSLDDSLMKILVAVISLVKAPCYAFYIYDDKDDIYILKDVTSSEDGNAVISPSYSGLLPYKKEKFDMLPTINSDKVPDEISLLKQGKVPIVFLPLINKKGLILIGPVSNLSIREKHSLQQFVIKVNKLFEILLETEGYKSRIKQVTSSEKAVKNISNAFSNIRVMMEMLLDITVKSISASGGMFISKNREYIHVEGITGLENQLQEQIINDNETLSLFFELIDDRDMFFLTKSDKEFFKIPPYFAVDEIAQLVFININCEEGQGLAVFWYKDNLSFRDYQIAAIKILSKRMGDLINDQINSRRMSSSYADILKTLANLVDNLNKNSVSYSELMYRYSYVIAAEMKLAKEDVQEVALAAYLSNIGIIGLSEQLLSKKGKYNEMEYETMKHHSESGAAIIEATLGNTRVASYIRHHHERYDGHGYPSRLKGEEIPLGARIIFVVQTFLAKVLSRDYREALPFEDVIKQLKIASGTQLDRKVVDTLIEWFDKKEKQFKDRNCALGNCFDMRCTPEDICINCPAYKDTTKNCWEFKNVRCSEHGNRCETCFVRTEYLYRMKKQ